MCKEYATINNKHYYNHIDKKNICQWCLCEIDTNTLRNKIYCKKSHRNKEYDNRKKGGDYQIHYFVNGKELIRYYKEECCYSELFTEKLFEMGIKYQIEDLSDNYHYDIVNELDRYGNDNVGYGDDIYYNDY